MIKLSTKQRKVFFISDYHFNHNRSFIFERRGFKTVSEHDQFLLERTNEVVGQNDVLFNLGDFSLNSSVDRTKDLVNRIICQNVFYLWGNHESYMKKLYKEKLARFADVLDPDMRIYPLKYENFTFLGNSADISIDGQHIFLSHFPARNWDHSNHGAWHIHGHEHGNTKESSPSNLFGKVLDVGWEVFMRPMSFSEIQKIMNNKQIVNHGHH